MKFKNSYLKKSSENKRKKMLKIALLIGSIFIVGFFILKKFNLCFNCINEDVEKVAKILNKIHSRCKIEKFTNTNNSIDFLNVREFSGDTIGSVKLERPMMWEGPYLNSNPSFNGKLFSVLVNKKGYYLVPGNETVLDDGSVVGKDIIFDQNSEVEEMCKSNKKALYSNGKCLVKKLNIEIVLPVEEIKEDKNKAEIKE